MKQLVVNALVSLISGIFLVIGIGGSIWIAEKLMTDKTPKENRFMRTYETLPASSVLESSVVTGVPNFTVRGSLRNPESTDWDIAEISVEILSKGVKVNTCKRVDEWSIVKAGQESNLLVECKDVKVPKSGENFDYRVTATKIIRNSIK